MKVKRFQKFWFQAPTCTPYTADEFVRLNSKKARAWFVLVDHTAEDPHEADRAAVLRCVAVKKLHPRLHVFAQCVLLANSGRLHLAGADFVVCEQEIKVSLLAQNILCPGIMVMLLNLMHSQSQWENRILHNTAVRRCRLTSA